MNPKQSDLPPQVPGFAPVWSAQSFLHSELLSLSRSCGTAKRKEDVSRASETITFTVRLPRALAADNGQMRLFCDDTGEVFFLPMTRSFDRCFASELWTVRVRGKDFCKADRAGGLFYYRFCFDTPRGHCIFSKEPDGFAPILRFRDENIHAFQWTVTEDTFAPPESIRGGIMYHIFVDRFCKGKKADSLPKRADAVYNEDWYEGVPQHARLPGGDVKNNEFFGGTLWGIAEKLPYLRSLGVTILYLSPIFRAYSNHKYDTGDYEAVDPGFGGEEALAFLLRRAEKAGIRVICDGVFNHTGDNSRYFNRTGAYDTVGAYQSKDSPYYGWYRFRTYPDDYDCWWGVRTLPAVRSDDSDFRNFICGPDGVLHRWMQMGVSGWRLDVADELSDTFLCDLRTRVKAENPDAVIYGEVWEDASNKIAYDHRRQYFRGRQLDSVMNYPFRTGILAFLCDRNAEALAKAVETVIRHYPAGTVHTLMNLLGTHDTERILTVLAADPAGDRDNDELAAVHMTEEQRKRGIRLVMLASLLQFTLPGIPSIYYGDEAGMEGYRDPFNRRPYPWGREDKDLIAWYQNLAKLRTDYRAVFADGDTELCYAQNGIFAFLRSKERRQLLICVNRSPEPFVIPHACRNLLNHKKYPEGFTLSPDTGAVLLLSRAKTRTVTKDSTSKS